MLTKPNRCERKGSEAVAAAGYTPTSIWLIGHGLVTTAEIESWQLGPDRTEAAAEEENFTAA